MRLETNDRAPHAGLLLLERTVVDWRQRIQLLERSLVIEATAATERLDLERQAGADRLDAERQRRGLEVGLYRERVTSLARELEEARSGPEWYESPILWFVVGFVLAGAGAVAAAVAFGGS